MAENMTKTKKHSRIYLYPNEFNGGEMKEIVDGVIGTSSHSISNAIPHWLYLESGKKRLIAPGWLRFSSK